MRDFPCPNIVFVTLQIVFPNIPSRISNSLIGLLLVYKTR